MFKVTWVSVFSSIKMGVLIWIPLNTNFLIANVELKEVFFSSYWASLYIETLVYRKCIFFKKKSKLALLLSSRDTVGKKVEVLYSKSRFYIFSPFLSHFNLHQSRKRVNVMGWIVHLPKRRTEVLKPRTCECDQIWKWGIWFNQVRMRSVWWAMTQYDWCLYKKRENLDT